MSARHKILGLILARGGSRGVPGKNIAMIAGKPLIAHAIEAAQASKRLDRLVVSTDDPRIAEVAKSFGAEVPFMRPKALARDDTPDFPALRHAVSWLEKEEG